MTFENTLAKVQALHSEGKSPVIISYLLGLKTSTIRQYLYIIKRGPKVKQIENEGIKVEGFVLKREESDKKKEDIIEAAKWFTSAKDVALLTETPLKYAQDVLHSLWSLKKRRVEVIERAVKEGVNSLEELCVRVGVIDCMYLKKYCEEHAISLPKDIEEGNRFYPRRPAYDEMIAKGASLGEMERKLGGSRELARQYIVKSRQYREWKKKREEQKPKINPFKNPKNFRKILTRQIRGLLAEKAKEEPWAIEKAVNYFLGVRHHPKNLPLEKIVEVFQVYEEAKNKGEKVGVWELGKRVGLIGTTYWRVLHLADVEPMYGTEKYTPRNYKIKACLRGAKTLLSFPDIAHFLELPEHLSSLRYEQKGISKKPGEFLANLGSLKRISYRNASKIYEAKDIGFKKEEIVELYGLSQKIVEHVLANRKGLEKKIVNELKILFGNKGVKHPYVAPWMKRLLDKEE